MISQVVANKHLNDYKVFKQWLDSMREENEKLDRKDNELNDYFLRKYKGQLRELVVAEYKRKHPGDTQQVAEKAVKDVMSGKRGLEQQQSLLKWTRNMAVKLGRESTDPEIKAKVAEVDKYEKALDKLSKDLEKQEEIFLGMRTAEFNYKDALTKLKDERKEIDELEAEIAKYEKKISETATGVKGEGRRHKHRRHGGCESCGGNDRFD